jgi:hypothetical protein
MVVKLTSFFRFSVDQYHRLVDSGVFTPEDRCELIHGWIVKKMPQKPPHSSGVGRIIRRLYQHLPEEWLVRCQCPITLADSEPEPDIVIVPGPEEIWDDRHPSAEDIETLIEVADSTLLADRRSKGKLYAEAGIKQFWLVNIPAGKIEVYTKPAGNKYGHCRVYKKNESVPLVIAGERVALLPVSGFFAR